MPPATVDNGSFNGFFWSNLLALCLCARLKILSLVCDSIGGGIEFQPPSNSLSGSLEDSEKYPHIEADALCSTRRSQGRLQCATEDMTHP